MIELPRTLLEAIHNTQRAFREHDLQPPTVMVVGEDIQRMLLYSGARPMNGTWGTIMGIEIRGVSDYIAGMAEGRLIFCPPHLRVQPFKQQVLGEFVQGNENES